MSRRKASADSMIVRGKRGSRAEWIAAARDILVRAGVEGIRINSLASALRITRGSFYWHFTARDELLRALLDDWEKSNYAAVAAIRASWMYSKADLNELVKLWIGEGTASPAFSMAIRAWARSDASVEAATHRVDNEWIDVLQLLFSPGIYDKSERLVRARVLYFHQIGYHALALREPQSKRLRLIPYYCKVLSGQEPDDALLKLLRSVETDDGTG